MAGSRISDWPFIRWSKLRMWKAIATLVLIFGVTLPASALGQTQADEEGITVW